jgi:hypothetical protein
MCAPLYENFVWVSPSPLHGSQKQWLRGGFVLHMSFTLHQPPAQRRPGGQRNVQTARNFMHVAQRFGDATNTQRIAHLEPTTLYLLAAPKTPDGVREEVLSRFDAGGVSKTPPDVPGGSPKSRVF